MSHFAVTAIKTNRVAHHQPMHPPAQIRSPRLCQKMEMIGQQNVGVQFDLKSGERMRHQFQKASPVWIVGEYRLAPVPSCAQVINCPCKLQPKRSRHEPKLIAHRLTMSKYLDATPLLLNFGRELTDASAQR